MKRNVRLARTHDEASFFEAADLYCTRFVGRIQSAERAVPTHTYINTMNLLSA